MKMRFDIFEPLESSDLFGDMFKKSEVEEDEREDN